MLKMKYLFYFINWLNNAIIKLKFIIIWYCFVIFGYILALFDIILVTFVKKHHFTGVDHNCSSIFENALCKTLKLSPAVWAKFFGGSSFAIFSF